MPYFEVRDPDAFFDFKNGKVVLTFEHSNFYSYKSAKPLRAYVKQCVNDSLTPVPDGMLDLRENFLDFSLPLSKLLDLELESNTVDANSRGKNITATSDRRELYEKMAGEFEVMAKRLRSLNYID